jgi:hypothetical protein
VNRATFWAIIAMMCAMTISHGAGYYSGRRDAQRNMKTLVEGYVRGSIDANLARLRDQP